MIPNSDSPPCVVLSTKPDAQGVGAIPNRGLLQPDIELAGIHYLQQVKDVLAGVGIHVEPGF
jgi:hypothetical protein